MVDERDEGMQVMAHDRQDPDEPSSVVEEPALAEVWRSMDLPGMDGDLRD